VLEGLRGEDSIAELLPQGRDQLEPVLPVWSKEFLEAGKKRLAGDTTRGIMLPSFVRRLLSY
jgi:transposase